MVHRIGFEPTTLCSEDRCSNPPTELPVRTHILPQNPYPLNASTSVIIIRAMNKSELKKFAAIFRSTLSQAFKQQLQALNLDDLTTLPSNPTPDYAALSRALRALTPARVLETATYTWFNRLVALRFMELRDLLPPEAPSPWDSRDHLLHSTHQLATQLPQIFTGPAYLDLFLP